jgi:ubiquinone/menaquinone biosynthesis C-methylase UbiE
MGSGTVSIAGGDTAEPLNLARRVGVVQRAAEALGGLAGQTLLDCGCGAGAYVRAYATLGARVLGIEYSREKLAVGMRLRTSNTLFAVGDLEHLPISDASIDVAVFNEVLEHVPDDAAAVREARRVLRPSGRLVVMSPNRLYPFESHGVSLKHSGRDLPVYTPFVPYVPLPIGERFLSYWARNYFPWALRRLVRDAGFRILETGFVAQTFENVSGRQAGLLRRSSPALRAIAGWAERRPGLRAFASVSQIIIATPRG